MENLISDIRFGARQLVKAPGFTAIAILSLALGIGANTAIFSLVNTVLVRPLPVPHSEQIVAVNRVNLKHPDNMATWSYPNYVDFRDRNQALAGIAVHRFVPLSLSRSGNNERIWGYLASGNYFDLLGVSAYAGRLFTQDDDLKPGANPVAVLSYTCWQQRFGGDRDLIGNTILLNGNRFTVIGVAPPGFIGTELIFTSEIWVPMMMGKQIEPGSNWLEQRGNGVMFAFGRLKSGATIAESEAALNLIAEQSAQEYPNQNEGQGVSLGAVGLVIPQFRDPVVGFAGVLMATVGLVLLIACTNLASLLLARATQRKREIAIRLALGASRRRLVRQLLTESVLLGVAGGVVGALLGMWIVNLVAAFHPPVDFPLTIDLRIDWRVLIFTSVLSLATGILFGLIPALQTTKPDVVPTLKDESPAGGHRRSWLRSGLVVVQVALSLVLLIASGLIVRSLQKVQMIGPGFETERAVTVSLDVSLQGYDQAKGLDFYRKLTQRVASSPGVKSVSMTNWLPLSLNRNSSGIYIEGQEATRGAETPESMNADVWPNYFEAMGIPILEGRDFTERDASGSTRVAMINESFARKFWPGQSALGKRFSFGGSAGNPLVEVVGVARDGKYFSLGEDSEPFVWTPLLQSYNAPVSLVVRTTSEPRSILAAVRSEVQQLDANLPIYDVHTLSEHMSLSLFPMRVGAVVVGAFGILALVLAAIGIYGVMAYSAGQRTREIGIRMALGAGSGDVLRLIAKRGVLLGSIGITAGLLIAFLTTRLMASVLYGVSATDLVTFALVTLLLGLVIVLACYIPARRAARVDPIVALRYE